MLASRILLLPLYITAGTAEVSNRPASGSVAPREDRADRRAKVELFERIRREYGHGGGTIRGIAKKLGIHRRMVREALLSAVPVERKTPVRE